MAHVALIANLVATTATLPIELAPGHFLRRPNEAETIRLREALRANPEGTPVDLTMYFEQDGSEPYLIVEIADTSSYDGVMNMGLQRLHEASLLLEHRLDFPVVLAPSGGWMLGGWTGVDPYRHIKSFGPRAALGSDYWDRLVNVRMAVEALDHRAFPRVGSAMQQFSELFQYPVAPRMLILGLFATLECLLCSDPEESRHAISQQFARKPALVEARAALCPNYGMMPGRADHRVIWKALYAYRSALAHGATPDFGKGALRVLHSRDSADAFVLSAARCYLLHALVEPRLISDLAQV